MSVFGFDMSIFEFANLSYHFSKALTINICNIICNNHFYVILIFKITLTFTQFFRIYKILSYT